MKQLANFAETLSIDQTNLDREWLAQPELFFRFASLLADAKEDVERCRARLQVTFAELDAEIRANPGDYGLEKVTEAALKSAILSNERYTNAQSEQIEAEHNANLLDAAVKSLDQRKRALENLVMLHGQSYFATPSVRGNRPEAREHFDQLRKGKDAKAKRPKT